MWQRSISFHRKWPFDWHRKSSIFQLATHFGAPWPLACSHISVCGLSSDVIFLSLWTITEALISSMFDFLCIESCSVNPSVTLRQWEPEKEIKFICFHVRQMKLNTVDHSSICVGEWGQNLPIASIRMHLAGYMEMALRTIKNKHDMIPAGALGV